MNWTWFVLGFVSAHVVAWLVLLWLARRGKQHPPEPQQVTPEEALAFVQRAERIARRAVDEYRMDKARWN